MRSRLGSDGRWSGWAGSGKEGKHLEVLALIGSSGTGKSHRASLVAIREGVDLVIDDGLLIKDGKILDGESAKRAPSRLAAVRRAIFADAALAAAAHRSWIAAAPERVLILGTSREMVDRIAATLELPAVTRYVDISEIASPGEIEKAREVRRLQGRHVIPAPTLEVKKTFSGYLVDPVRFMLPRGRRDRGMVIEKSVVRPTWSYLGRFRIADTVITQVAARAGLEVAGVQRVGGVSVHSRSDGILLRLELTFWAGTVLPRTMREVQESVRRMVEHMTALNVLAVDVVARRIVVPVEKD